MKAVEEDLTFDKKREFAAPYFPNSWYFFDWLADVIYEWRGMPSPYDYVARVSVCEEMFNGLSLRHRKAARLKLERIIANLAPEPNAAQKAASDPMELVEEASRIANGNPPTEEIRPLNDEAVRRAREDIRQRRYTVLTGAFARYADLALDDLEEHLQEQTPDVTDFQRRFEQLEAGAHALQDRLKAAREALYENMPADESRSVSDVVIDHRRNRYIVREELEHTADAKQLLRQVEQTEKELRDRLARILTEARELIEEADRRRKGFHRSLSRLEIFYRLLEEGFEADFRNAFLGRMQTIKGRIDERFSLLSMLPPAVRHDLQVGRHLYRGGNA